MATATAVQTNRLPADLEEDAAGNAGPCTYSISIRHPFAFVAPKVCPCCLNQAWHVSPLPEGYDPDAPREFCLACDRWVVTCTCNVCRGILESIPRPSEALAGPWRLYGPASDAS